MSNAVSPKVQQSKDNTSCQCRVTIDDSFFVSLIDEYEKVKHAVIEDLKKTATPLPAGLEGSDDGIQSIVYWQLRQPGAVKRLREILVK
ncbi:hypothetical protein [Klebsiella quasipneumoniae]|uniref:hypothetical protein n=1 Tax=Klebsiella quasipneumoniae TaxID=1463165 RepID=UPI0021DA697D|nr:hypothetical protein [Klebsiella quasipneumoniae]MCU8824781.1 hypothetical protein [Klebsiella quasipneumoniae]